MAVLSDASDEQIVDVLRRFEGPARARDVLAALDGISPEQAAASSRLGQVSGRLRALGERGALDRDYARRGCTYEVN
jgi:hypothetical protein